jgi:hypothetical protein
VDQTLPPLPEPRFIPGFYDIDARRAIRYTAEDLQAYATEALRLAVPAGWVSVEAELASRPPAAVEPVAWVWNDHKGPGSKSLRWSKPNQWEYATSVEPLYASPPVQQVVQAPLSTAALEAEGYSVREADARFNFRRLMHSNGSWIGLEGIDKLVAASAGHPKEKTE